MTIVYRLPDKLVFQSCGPILALLPAGLTEDAIDQFDANGVFCHPIAEYAHPAGNVH